MSDKPKVITTPTVNKQQAQPPQVRQIGGPRMMDTDKILVKLAKAMLELDMANEEVAMLRQALNGISQEFTAKLTEKDETIKALEIEIVNFKQAGNPGSIFPFEGSGDSSADDERVSDARLEQSPVCS